MKNFVELNNEEIMDVNGGASYSVNNIYNSATGTITYRNMYMTNTGKLMNMVQSGSYGTSGNVFQKNIGGVRYNYRVMTNHATGAKSEQYWKA